MPSFAAVSQQDFEAAVRALAAALAADAGWSPDRLVGIGRGGLVPAVYLSHATGTPMLSLDWSGGVPTADGMLARLAALAAAGERLLLVDDINDSGHTIAALRTALAAAGAPSQSIRVAVLIDNSRSAERVDYRARTIDRTVTKDWFVFPWEAVAPASSIAADATEVPARTA